MEEWRSIPDWDAYEVSNLGRVRRGSRILKPNMTLSGSQKHGYRTCCVQLSNGKAKRYRIAELVLLAFVGPRLPALVARHLDDNQTNNCLTNLKWGTHKENGEDRKKNKLSNPGEKNGNHMLTEDNVRRIRLEYKPYSHTNGLARIAEKYGVSISSVCNIVRNKVWKGI